VFVLQARELVHPTLRAELDVATLLEQLVEAIAVELVDVANAS
jgi:hypothetical protein